MILKLMLFSWIALLLQAQNSYAYFGKSRVPGGLGQFGYLKLKPEEIARVINGVLPVRNRPSQVQQPQRNSGNPAAGGDQSEYDDSMLPLGVSLKNDMSEVKKQGGERGTCSAFAAIALLEYKSSYRFSEQCLVKMSSNTDSGVLLQRVMWAAFNGLYAEKDCPYYEHSNGGREIIPDRIKDIPPIRFQTSVDTEKQAPYQSIETIKKKISKDRIPVGISVYAVGDWWEDFDDRSPLMIPTKAEIENNCESKDKSDYSCTGHALVVTGYNDSTRTLEVKNSWGKEWKNGGYGRISYDYFNRFHIEDDLVFAKVLNPYSEYESHITTALHETGNDFQFLRGDNGDLYAIKKSGPGINKTEVHVLSAASGYKTFSLHTQTCLHETGDDFDFCLASNQDIFAIKKYGAGISKTEVHVLSAASGYKTFSLHTDTCLHETGDNFEFCLAPNRDLYAIKKSGSPLDATEVHVLSAATGYKTFSLHAATCLHQAADDFEFCLAPNKDLYAIKKKGSPSNSAEVHVLSAATGYQTFSLQVETCLRKPGDHFEFCLGKNNDLTAIQKHDTVTKQTEVHIIMRNSKPLMKPKFILDESMVKNFKY